MLICLSSWSEQEFNSGFFASVTQISICEEENELAKTYLVPLCFRGHALVWDMQVWSSFLGVQRAAGYLYFQVLDLMFPASTFSDEVTAGLFSLLKRNSTL